MKFIATTILTLSLLGNGHAQDILASLDAAQSAYAAGNSQQARQHLQQALIDLNVRLGHQVLATLPATLGGLEINQNEETVVGGTGFAGLMISRTYSNDTKRIKITIANDSPTMSMVSSFLSNDMLSGIMASQTGQKKVVVSGYKGMLEKSDYDDDTVAYTLNIPLEESLFTLEARGFASENEVLDLAQQIDLRKIAGLLH